MSNPVPAHRIDKIALYPYDQIMRRVIIFSILMAILLPPMQATAVKRAPRITDREIVERLTRLEEGQKAIKEEMRAQIGNVNKRIDDLRAEMNSKFDNVNKRIDDLHAEMNSKFDDVNMRINDLRAEMNGRFDTLQRMFGFFIAISLVILGFVLRMQWQMQKRQTTMETTLNSHREDLVFLKELVKKLLPPKGVL